MPETLGYKKAEAALCYTSLQDLKQLAMLSVHHTMASSSGILNKDASDSSAFQ